MAGKSAERTNPYFRFLRRMHAGGRSTMYGAIPYLSAAFGCDRDEAYRIVCEWVDLQDHAAKSAACGVAEPPRARESRNAPGAAAKSRRKSVPGRRS